MSATPQRRQSGFSLIELLIGMVIAIEILVAALTIFDVHNRMARVQLQITEMQQSVRVAQYDMVRATRLTGRGGLPPAFRVDTDDISVPWLRG
ncbi:MAG: prepilin-type N-terminal cleavage/methylation domain-containing protein, partial [Thermoanaerobaculia bacterium]